LFLPNGGLLYVDVGCHPEVATPECTTPWEAVSQLRAGERTVHRLALLAAREVEADSVLVSRANVDYRFGTTWGCHESYLGTQPPAHYKNWLIPHLVTRIVYTGSGGLDALSPGIRLSLSPRVSHIDHAVSPESTNQRGIFHTRDEPLSSGYRRIHVLAGDNTCSHRSTWLKIGTTALVVALAEAPAADADLLHLRDPVRAMKGFARDLAYRATVQYGDGRVARMSATEIQRELLARVEALALQSPLPAWAPEVCTAWRAALDLIDSPLVHGSHAFDWPLKFSLFRREIERRGLSEPQVSAWSNAVERLYRNVPVQADGDAPIELDHAHIERVRTQGLLGDAELAFASRLLELRGLSWAGLDAFNDLRRHLCAIDVRFGALGEGLFDALDRQGMIPDHRMVTEAEIAAAMDEPPCGSRAFARGRWVRRLAGRRGQRYVCNWQGIGGARLHLDLGDPFARDGTWQRRRKHRIEPMSGVALQHIRRLFGFQVM
jgi:proteasome accessory factor A